MTLVLPFGSYAGVNGPLLRKAAGKLADMGSAKLYDMAVVLGVSPGEARPTWEQLIAEGFIIETTEGHMPTPRMDDLARARFGNPLPRKKADALLAQVVAAAKKLNELPADAPYFWITAIAVFGSYLDAEKQELGDLDVAWELEERPGVRNHLHKAIIYNFDAMQTTRGKVVPRSPFVRLTDAGTLLSLECPYKVVYSFESEDLTRARAQRAVEREEHRRQAQELEKLMRTSMAELTSRIEKPIPRRKRHPG